MTTVDTTTTADATGLSNQRKISRTSAGRIWTLFNSGGTAELWYSDDDGATFAQNASGSITNFSNGSLFIDVDDHAHLVYKNTSDGVIYYRRMASIGTATSWSTDRAAFTGTSEYNYPDVVAHREGTGWAAHAVCSIGNGTGSSNNNALYNRLTIASGGGITADSQILLGAGYSVANHKYPSIDFNHTGDGKTVAGGTPHLYVGWSAGATGAGKGIRFKKATYSAGSWTWGTEREIDSTRFSATAQWHNCFFDGTRVVIAGLLYDGAANDLVIYERDAADTTTTTRLLLDNATAAEVLFYGSGTYDGSGNVYVFGRNNDEAAGTYDLVYRKWTRSTATLEAEVVVDAGVGNPWMSCKRGYSNNRIEFIYTDGTASPYSVTYDSISLNTPPNAPTSLSPTGTTIDRTATNRFSWSFSDPDAGDSQSGYDLRYRVSGGTIWTVVSGSTPNQFHDFAGGTFAAGDYEWQVRTYDAAGAVGPYSSSAFFTAASPPAAPSITDPVAGQTIASESYTVQWSTTSQSSYQVRTVADSAGSPDPTTVYTDTGEVVSTSARSRTVSFAVNNRAEHVQVRVKVSGLWSTWTSVNVTVSYTPPATPTVTATGDSPAGAISVTATHPTPGAGHPTVTSQDVHRRVASTGGDGIRVAAALAPSATLTDWAVASGVVYEYRVRAYGDNGTSTYSTWTA